MKTALRVKKAIVLAGGTGGRLNALTNGKICKVNVEIEGKPIVVYQLESLKKLGVQDVCLVVRAENRSEFWKLINAGKYPKMNYTLVNTPHAASGYHTKVMLAKVFKEKAIAKFAGANPVIITYGDAFYFQKFLKRALASFYSKKRTVFLAQPQRTTHPVKESFYEKIVESSSIVRAMEYNPSFNGFIATGNFFKFFCNTVSSTKSTLRLLASAHKQGLNTAIMHGQVINVNTPADYIALREVLAKKLRFPFPLGWVRRYKKELQGITNRREDRWSHKKRTKAQNRKKRK